jgi:hypothetical protein
MIERIRKLGWLAVEAAALLIVLCMLLNIILGKDSGPFISAVAANATQLLQAIPPGTFLGVILIVALCWLFRSRFTGQQ